MKFLSYLYSRKTFLEDKIFYLFCVLWAFRFFSLSQSSLWVETEIFPSHSSQYLFSPFQSEFLFSLKPLFYLLLKLSFILSESLNILPLTMARSLFAFIGFGTLLLMYQLIKHKTSHYHALLAVLTLASSYVFLERGFRVRSDLLLSFVSLLTLFISLKFQKPKRYYAVFGLLLTLFFISPKSIYWFVLTGLLLLYDSKISYKKLLPYGIKTLAVFLLLALGLSFLLQDALFIKSFQQSALYFWHSAKSHWEIFLKGGLNYALYNSSHLGLFIENNPILCLLILVQLAFIINYKQITVALKKPLSWRAVFIAPFIQQKTSAIGTRKILSHNKIFLFLLFVALFHPQQKMFFLCALSPFFILLFFSHPKWFLSFNQQARSGFKSLLLLVAFFYSGFAVWQFPYKEHRTNQEQKALLKELNLFYKKASQSYKAPLKIFDPLCLVYAIKTDCKYLNSLPDVRGYLQQNRFDILIPSYGVSDQDILSLRFNNWSYIPLNNNIYYKAFVRDFKNQSLWYKNYLKKPGLLDGKKILQELLDSFKKSSPDTLPQHFFYLYIPSSPHTFTVSKNCPTKSAINIPTKKPKQKPLLTSNKGPNAYKSSKTGQAACLYTKEELQSLPFKKEKLALFYIPFPFHLKTKDSLSGFFHYDY